MINLVEGDEVRVIEPTWDKCIFRFIFLRDWLTSLLEASVLEKYFLAVLEHRLSLIAEKAEDFLGRKYKKRCIGGVYCCRIYAVEALQGID